MKQQLQSSTFSLFQGSKLRPLLLWLSLAIFTLVGVFQRNKLLSTSSLNIKTTTLMTTDQPPPPLPSHNDVVVVMADTRFDNKNHSIQMTLAVNRLYAKLHGYRFFPCNINNLPPGECFRPGWPGCKLYCIRQALKFPNVTSILYLDSDVIVRNVSLQLEDFLQQHLPSNSSTKITGEQEDQNHSSLTTAKKSPLSFELIVPGDCEPNYVNTGIQVWHNVNDTAFVLLNEWIERSHVKPFKYVHPFEQGALRQWIFESNSSVAQFIRIIPRGPSTWHMARCYRSSTYPNYLVHIPGRWPHQRKRVFKEIIQEVCQSFSNLQHECTSQLIPLTQVEYQ